MSLRLLALNLSSPTPERARRQLLHLAGEQADVLVLSELSAGSGSVELLQALRGSGHQVVLPGLEGRSLGVAVVSRGIDLDLLPEPADAPLQGRVVTVRAEGLVLAGVYGAASDPVRYSSQAQRARKRDWLAWFSDWMRQAPADLVVGDLNIADPLVADGLAYVLAEETACYADLLRQGWVDAYRLHQLAQREPSWVDHSGLGARYDHALVSDELVGRVADCRLEHEVRSEGLSDHSALLLELD
ncbi:exodeoxyribonuclease III [Luteococcus peritonei]|uniref:Endonuclease/exonuclease/phosphatase family protein n=1 Tax=Luteococcus peritonei TaxID=88874 RepID=A0ABW4RYV8_9ACTN